MARFDHERLDVYQLALQFLTWVTPLIEEVKRANGPRTKAERDHLNRASLSILLNIAEGNGKRPGRLRGRFFDDARDPRPNARHVWMRSQPSKHVMRSGSSQERRCSYALFPC